MKKLISQNLLLLFTFTLVGCDSNTEIPIKELQGKRIAVLAYNGVEESEVIDSIRTLKDRGAEVHVVSGNGGVIKTHRYNDPSSSGHLSVNAILEDIISADYSGLLIPGGKSSVEAAIADRKAVNFVLEMEMVQKPIASICHGPLLLAAANLVLGRTLTSIHKIQNEIQNAGGTWKDEAVVSDKNWITSRHPKDVPAFNEAMVSLFRKPWNSAFTVPSEILKLGKQDIQVQNKYALDRYSPSDGGSAGGILIYAEYQGKRHALLGREKYGHQKGTWSFMYGSLHPGESIAQAAARELHEESGGIYWVSAEELPKYPYVRHKNVFLLKKNYISPIYLRFSAGYAQECDFSEMSDYAWISFNQLRSFLEKLSEIIINSEDNGIGDADIATFTDSEGIIRKMKLRDETYSTLMTALEKGFFEKTGEPETL